MTRPGHVMSSADNPGPKALLMKALSGSDVDQHEQCLRQPDLSAAVAGLLAGIAHEINTPMQYVMGNVQFLSESFRSLQGLVDGESTREDETVEYLAQEVPRALADTAKGAERIAAIVRAIQEFSSTQNEQEVLVDVNALLENAATLTRGEWKYVAEIATEYDTSLPCVRCPASRLRQSVLTLFLAIARGIKEAPDLRGDAKCILNIRTRCVEGRAQIEFECAACALPSEIEAHGRAGGFAQVQETVVQLCKGEFAFEHRPDERTVIVLRIPLNGGDPTSARKSP